MSNINESEYKFHYYIIISVLLYRTNDCITKLLISNIDAFEIMFFRSLFSILFLAILLIWTKPNFKISFEKYVILRNLLAAIALFFEVASLKYISLSTFILINYTLPIFAKFFAWIMLSEKISKLDIIVIVLSIVGGLFILDFSYDDSSLYGAILAFVGVIFYALSLVTTKKVKSDDFTTICFSYAIVIFLMSLIHIPQSLPVSRDILLLILMTFVHIAAFLFSIIGLKSLKTSKVVILEYLGLVFAVSFDYIFWHTVLSIQQISGAGIIIFSSLISIYREGLFEVMKKVYIFLRKRTIRSVTNPNE